jgi:GNAT superfamily N-acetyltransferase
VRDDRLVPLTVTTEHAEIAALLSEIVAADPVRGTVLGTVLTSLEDTAWCARWADGVAVRSGRGYPLVLHGSASGVAGELAGALQSVPGWTVLSGPAGAVRAVAAALPERTPTHEMAQRLFRLDELVAPEVAGRPMIATERDGDLVLGWYRAFAAEAHAVVADAERAAARIVAERGCFLWCVDGTAVSMAARRPVLAGSARIGPVFTPSEHRGHGYGSAVTAAATRSVMAEGAVPVLFTDLANPTSNRIYQALGYRPVEDRLMITFR